MVRFVTFVDGSNLDGSLKRLGLRVDNYSAFYRHIFECAVQVWGQTFAEGCPWPPAQHARTYWYAVGKIDEWDLEDTSAINRLKRKFETSFSVRQRYSGEYLRNNPDVDRSRSDLISDGAWNLYFQETSSWYYQRRNVLEKKKKFYHSVQATSDFIQINQDGHWKVDMLFRNLDEKGVDTNLAVDMVTLSSTYDVALLISADADGIPSINWLKNNGKSVGVVEFNIGDRVNRYPHKVTSGRLKLASDFVVSVYGSDLVGRDLAYAIEDKGLEPDPNNAEEEISSSSKDF